LGIVEKMQFLIQKSQSFDKQLLNLSKLEVRVDGVG